MNDESSGGTVLVVGSANIDMVVTCDRFPQPGETILGKEFEMYPGGKGANQAVACAKLGGHVDLISRMGNDVFRDRLKQSLEKDGVGTAHVQQDSFTSTGTALIAVDCNGQNEIVVVPGSNMMLTPDELERDVALFGGARVVLLQLEIPLETVRRAAELAQSHGAVVILNPAPATDLPDDLLKNVDFLTPNESECELLTGVTVTDLASGERAAGVLLERGVGMVIVTMGEQGALLVGQEGARHFPTVPVDVVDTTGAGDAFNGGLAFGIASGLPLNKSIELANTVASFSVTRKGAQSSMPSIEEIHFDLSLADGSWSAAATNR